MTHPLEARVDRASGVPLGTQLAGQIRDGVADGSLRGGDRLPSVRELAEGAGVNVNTVRAVYARLESEGLVRSEHGRGTFVASAEAPSRQELREQIAALEAALARLPPPPLPEEAERRPRGAALLSTAELVEVRDRLLDRLQQLDSERRALLESLAQLGLEAEAARAEPAEAGGVRADGTASRRETPSLAGARIRWVGA
jgi:DNA-binding transcriptional regulator YhcF (GntR family)